MSKSSNLAVNQLVLQFGFYSVILFSLQIFQAAHEIPGLPFFCGTVEPGVTMLLLCPVAPLG